MAPKECSDFSPDMLDDLLQIYYKKLFPSNLFCRWLSYGRLLKNSLAYREFSFTLRGDVYLRYQSFVDQSEFRTELIKMAPHKIDIGAVYSHRPKDQRAVKSAAFQPQSKELVFDIDMTDYDEVRFCCSEASICAQCWPLMRFAVRVMDRALREDFGFEHLLWVYSGRRGIHCWVCDETARQLSSTARSAIAEYLSLVKGGANQVKKVNLGNSNCLHPSVEEAIRLISADFERYAVEDQDFLGTGSRVDQLLNLLPEEMADQRDSLRADWVKREDGVASSRLRWNTLTKFLSSINKTRVLQEIMLQYAYPRLDVHVTTGLNHLLKSPFCVHPKTGRICVPFDASRIDEFDPFVVPTISQLIDELDRTAQQNTAGPSIAEPSTTAEGDQQEKKPIHLAEHLLLYKQTSLRPSVQFFESFVVRMEAQTRGERVRENDKDMEF